MKTPRTCQYDILCSTITQGHTYQTSRRKKKIGFKLVYSTPSIIFTRPWIILLISIYLFIYLSIYLLCQLCEYATVLSRDSDTKVILLGGCNLRSYGLPHWEILRFPLREAIHLVGNAPWLKFMELIQECLGVKKKNYSSFVKKNSIMKKKSFMLTRKASKRKKKEKNRKYDDNKMKK